jgi:hypothetical protein
MTFKETKVIHDKIAAFIERHPTTTYTEMSAELGISIPMISKIAREHGIRRGPQKKQRSAADVARLLAKLEE